MIKEVHHQIKFNLTTAWIDSVSLSIDKFNNIDISSIIKDITLLILLCYDLLDHL